MSSARLGRGTKSKVFIYICCILVLGTVIYVFHGTQSQLDDVKKAANICAQQQESLSAQLQVIFEYKLRLEKSLQKEKADHRQTKEKLLAQLEEEKQSKQKENLENLKKFNSLQTSYDLLQAEHKTLNEEFTELKNKQTENNEAQEILKKEAEELKTQLEIIKNEKDELIEKLKTDNQNLLSEKQKLLNENEQLSKNFINNDDDTLLSKTKNIELVSKVKDLMTQLQACTTRESVKYEENAANEVQENQPVLSQIVENKVSVSGVSKALNSSTTPFINPQAVIDHDAGAIGAGGVSSAKPLVDPMKAVYGSMDDNAAEEKKDKPVGDQPPQEERGVIPNLPEDDLNRNNRLNVYGNDVLGAPALK